MSFLAAAILVTNDNSQVSTVQEPLVQNARFRDRKYALPMTGPRSLYARMS